MSKKGKRAKLNMQRAYPTVTQLDRTIDRANGLIEQVRIEERQKVERDFNERYLPQRRVLDVAQHAIAQLVARIDELALIGKGMRKDVLTERAKRLASELAACGRDHKSLAITFSAEQSYIDGWTEFISIAQDAVDHVLRGDLDAGAALLGAGKPMNMQFGDYLDTVNFGGRKRGPGPLQAHILNGVIEVWQNSDQSLEWSARHYHQGLIARWKSDEELPEMDRKALDKLNAAQSAESYVENLWKQHGKPKTRGG